MDYLTYRLTGSFLNDQKLNSEDQLTKIVSGLKYSILDFGSTTPTELTSSFVKIVTSTFTDNPVMQANALKMQVSGQEMTSVDNKRTFSFFQKIDFLPSTSTQQLKLYVELTKPSANTALWEYVISYIGVFDLLLIILLFAFFSRSLIKLLRQIYYSLFAQMNLFTYKLNKFNRNMLKPVEEGHSNLKKTKKSFEIFNPESASGLKNRGKAHAKALKNVRNSQVVPERIAK